MPSGGRLLLPLRDLPANKNPTGTRCITIEIPDDDEWERDLYSTIYDGLAMWLCWKRDIGKNGTRVARRWKKALSTWTRCTPTPPQMGTSMDEENLMPTWKEECVDGKYILSVRTCACPETWEQVWPPMVAPNGQPGTGQGTTPPPGGTQQSCLKLIPDQGLLMPWTVNSGDIITLDSCTGSAWDGSEGSPLGIWRLGSNGDQMFGGVDVGFPRTVSTDPLNTFPHMAIIAAIGTGPTYLALPLGVPTVVPSVPANSQVRIQNNTTPYTDCQSSGEDVCVTVKNNAPTTWSKTWNFALNMGEWTVDTVHGGVWTPGTGVVSTDEPGSSPAVDHAVIDLVIPPLGSSTITGWGVTVNSTIDGSGASVWLIQLADITFAIDTVIPAVLGVHTYNATQFPTSGMTVFVECALRTATAFGGFTQMSMTMSGTGSNPFA